MNRKALASAVVQDIVRVAREIGHTPSRDEYILNGGKFKKHELATAFGSWATGTRAAGLEPHRSTRQSQEVEFVREARIGIFDIETAPLEGFFFSPKTDYIGHKNVEKDTAVIAFAWKWLGDKASKLIYRDTRKEKDPRNDKRLLVELRDLLCEADSIITKNGKRFDVKVAAGRMEINRIKPPSPFKHEDVEQLARRHFKLPYYNLDYLSHRFDLKHKKSDHGRFPGIELWRQCLRGNMAAWREMEKYNKLDVLATEEFRMRVIPWGTNVDYNLFHGEAIFKCQCGSTDLLPKGHAFTAAGMFKQFVCRACGAWSRAKGQGNNLFTAKKKLSLRSPKD